MLSHFEKLLELGNEHQNIKGGVVNCLINTPIKYMERASTPKMIELLVKVLDIQLRLPGE